VESRHKRKKRRKLTGWTSSRGEPERKLLEVDGALRRCYYGLFGDGVGHNFH